jgi:hypothetical protein
VAGPQQRPGGGRAGKDWLRRAAEAEPRLVPAVRAVLVAYCDALVAEGFDPAGRPDCDRLISRWLGPPDGVQHDGDGGAGAQGSGENQGPDPATPDDEEGGPLFG